MLEISGKTNLLEQNAYKYSLQDVAEPNLQRDIYTQGMVPKVPFNHRRVPMNMPEEIWITDTSLRDGQQSVEPYTVDQIVNIYKYLSRLGGPYGIIRQTEFFIYSKKDREALEKCMELGLKFPEITTWIRATKEDFRLVRDLGIRETGILVSCSDYHIFKKMKMTRKQAMDYYLATVADAFEAGVVPRCHLEDITRADFYGFVVPFVNELQKLSRQAGIPVKIRACDTMGYGIPYTEAALPRSVAGIIYGLQQYSDVPSECLEWHGHNDFYKAVVNASTAWLYGAGGKNFVRTMLQLSRTHDTLRVVCDQVGTPTYVPDLARLLADMVETDRYGRYNAVNSGGYVSWYDFACEIFHTAGIPITVLPVTTEEYGRSLAVRPRNSRPDTAKLAAAGFRPLPDWQDALARYLAAEQP